MDGGTMAWRAQNLHGAWRSYAEYACQCMHAVLTVPGQCISISHGIQVSPVCGALGHTGAHTHTHTHARVARYGNTVRHTEYGTVRSTVFRWGNTVGEYGAAVDAPD
jgi:hypothetical protein